MGSISVPETNVRLPDNPKACSSSDLPAATTRNPVTERHISSLRELLKQSDDGSLLLVPGDDGYEESLRRWSRAAEKRAVSTIITLTRAFTYFFGALVAWYCTSDIKTKGIPCCNAKTKLPFHF